MDLKRPGFLVKPGLFSFAHTFLHILPAIVFGSPGALLNVAPGRAGQLFLV